MYRKLHAFRFGLVPALVAVIGFLFAGCSDNPVSPSSTATADGDVAMSLASAVGEDDGGVADQIGDLSEFLVPQPAGKIAVGDSISRTWDPATYTWTIQMQHERGLQTGQYYAHVQRTYQLRYRDKLGNPMQYWTNGTDTAYTVLFDIVGGSGEHHNLRVSQRLTGLSGSWTATGVNTDTVTINGTYSRSAVDTITTAFATRTLEHTMSMNFVDLKGPRGSRLDLSQKLSGTVTGEYQAQIAFQRGNAYRERNVERNFTIVLGDGSASINVNGKHFMSNVRTGDINQ